MKNKFAILVIGLLVMMMVAGCAGDPTGKATSGGSSCCQNCSCDSCNSEKAEDTKTSSNSVSTETKTTK